MKTLMAAVSLLLSASAALAGAPCQNPAVPACETACAALGAKLALSLRQQGAMPGGQVQKIGTGKSLDDDGFAGAQRLAHLARLSLDYIGGMTVQQARGAVAAYCPK